MPIIRAINGIVETYPVKPAAPRQAGQDQHSNGSRSDDLTGPDSFLGQHRERYLDPHDAQRLPPHRGYLHARRSLGMVPDRDLLRLVPGLSIGTIPTQAALHRLAEIMTTRVISATPETNIREIARIMLDERIHAVPILDRHRLLIGILSARDLLRGIANHGPLELWT